MLGTAGVGGYILKTGYEIIMAYGFLSNPVTKCNPHRHKEPLRERRGNYKTRRDTQGEQRGSTVTVTFLSEEGKEVTMS